MPNWKYTKIGNNVRYTDTETGVQISRYRYRQMKAGEIEIHPISRTIHKTTKTSLSRIQNGRIPPKGKSYGAYVRWKTDDGKYVQTSTVSTKNRKGKNIAKDIVTQGTAPSRNSRSRLPIQEPIQEEFESQQEEIDREAERDFFDMEVEFVAVSRL